jgi:hypothetical protein
LIVTTHLLTTLRVKGNKKTFSGPGASLVDFFVFQFRLPQNIYTPSVSFYLSLDSAKLHYPATNKKKRREYLIGTRSFWCLGQPRDLFFFGSCRMRGPYIGLSAARGNETIETTHHTRVDVAVPFELYCISSYVWLLDQCTYTA